MPRYRKFESISLQQRVACEPDFLAATGASVRPLIAADRFLKITMKGHIDWYVDDPQPSSSPPVHHQRAPGWSALTERIRPRWDQSIPEDQEAEIGRT